MATVDTLPPDTNDIPSHNRIEPGSFPLPIQPLPTSTNTKSDNPKATVSAWIQSFNEALSKNDIPSLTNHFLSSDSYWRDQLCLSWDFHTLQGREKIASFLSSPNPNEKSIRVKSISLDESSAINEPRHGSIGELMTVSSFLKVETDVGSGGGVVNLVFDEEESKWRAFTLFTFLKEIRGCEERVGSRRGYGYETEREGTCWGEKREREDRLEDGEVAVLVLGAGQAGLAIAARLKMLGVKTLVVDKMKRVGDNWRNRYASLVLHDPVWFDHLPYLSFPEHWPVHSPKDKLADWLEGYAKFMDLTIWCETTIEKSTWDDVKKEWTVNLTTTGVQNGSSKNTVIHPHHIVMATGHSGEPNFPSHITGINSFKGTLIHSSRFTGVPTVPKYSKHAIIVGSCNSGHDIAKHYYENGYHVTMIQRSSTYVVGVKTNADAMAALYGQHGPPVEIADALNMSLPNRVVKTLNVGATKMVGKVDEEILKGLERVGFKLDGGVDGSGIWMKYLQRGGGYYIDSGASQLIIDGHIKIKQGVEVTSILPNAVQFSDGTELPADDVVFATGYQSMNTTCAKIFGTEVASKTGGVWGLDEEGEIRGLWRDSGHQGFWFMAGNLMLCRWYSKILALRILGVEKGLC
ncbi:hypothetical protein HYALB_00013399 [Hymenoscyphus albidus]|uniref:FAD/NAD(P)-binding domain-containing protein n=1 Tax=Hymenoscyphus albidus TaxID=595503 RepID=A0A9N9LXC7_9HELO|nr:hypothetical protein HYALB_00013399 [Hymenoscyphus albidus]